MRDSVLSRCVGCFRVSELASLHCCSLCLLSAPLLILMQWVGTNCRYLAFFCDALLLVKTWHMVQEVAYDCAFIYLRIAVDADLETGPGMMIHSSSKWGFNACWMRMVDTSKLNEHYIIQDIQVALNTTCELTQCDQILYCLSLMTAIL
jgi:hypothetical protein